MRKQPYPADLATTDDPIPPTLKVAVLDDDSIARSHMRLALTGQPGITVVGAMAHGSELRLLLATITLDVVVLDALLRGENALDVIRTVRQLHPAVKVVVATYQHGGPLMLAALRAGAHAYLDRALAPEALVAALRLVAQGERLLPDQRAITLVVDEIERLSHAEAQLRVGFAQLDRDLLALVAAGWSNLAIAERFGYSLATTKRHLARMYAKLHAHDRHGAMVEAQRRGVI
ncbi:MAG TPA: response regulator transcription factor [Ktedonobacterales bacterium]|nr:response regulator transcription factor [Ktedonobacterales bacterium]